MSGPCDLWLCVGQSNMVGRGDSAAAPATLDGMAYDYKAGGISQLADPTGEGSFIANTGSLLPAFANVFTSASGRPSIFLKRAIGGTALMAASGGATGWWAGSSRYTVTVTAALDALTVLDGLGWEPTVHLAWHQGEKDITSYPNASTLQGDYRAALVDLLTRFRSDLSLPELDMFVWMVGSPEAQSLSRSESVQNAQAAACAATDGMHMVYTRCPDFAALGWHQIDGLHYNQTGYNDMGTLGAQAAALALGYGAPQVSSGPRASVLAGRLLAASL